MVGRSASPGFHDAAVVEALEPPLWLELFAAFGEPEGLRREGATIDHIADRLGVSSLPEPLQLALEWLYDLGSPEGCERIAAAAREFNVDLRALKGMEPVQFVAHVALKAATSPSARKAIDRAQTGALIASHPTSRVHEFRGREAKPIVSPEGRLADLGSRLAPLLDGEDLGERVDVTLRQEGEVTRIIVVRGKRVHAPVSFTDSGRRRLTHRPVQCDLIVYDADANLVSIHTSRSLVDGYRRAAGEVLWGDPDHLTPSACTLEPLKEGAGILARHSSVDVRAVTLTYAKFRPHEGGTCEYSGGDVFALMTRMGVPLSEGEFVAARFQSAFCGTGRRPMTIEVKPPTVKAADNNRQPIVLAALQQIGICRLGGEPAGPDVWNLAVGPHSRGAWRGIFSAADLDALVSERVLVSRRLASVSHAGAPAAGPVLDVIDAGDDPPFFGVSVDADLPGRRLTSSDVEGLELDARRLATHWAAAMLCAGGARELAVNGLYDLGECEFGSKRVHILLALREPPADVLRVAPTFPSPSVIVAPRSRATVRWPVPSVVAESMMPDRLAVRRAIVRELRLESEVDARDRARAQDTLIVDVSRDSVWLHGVKIEVSGAPHLFTLLVAKATQAGLTAARDDLNTKLAGKGAATNTAANAKSKAERLMKEALAAAGVAVPAAIFASKGGGYVYAGHAFVGD